MVCNCLNKMLYYALKSFLKICKIKGSPSFKNSFDNINAFNEMSKILPSLSCAHTLGVTTENNI